MAQLIPLNLLAKFNEETIKPSNKPIHPSRRRNQPISSFQQAHPNQLTKVKNQRILNQPTKFIPDNKHRPTHLNQSLPSPIISINKHYVTQCVLLASKRYVSTAYV